MSNFKYNSFTIQFEKNVFAPALIMPPQGGVREIIERFGLSVPRPVLFLSGGAGLMSEDDIKRTHSIMASMAKFADEHHLIVIDGGTDAGVMQMMGEIREKNDYKFPLIGVAPRLKVSYPNFNNPEAEAKLQRGHSHFVLIESDDWGVESQTIVDLTRIIAKQQYPMMGILINGGKIAEQDIYLATAKPTVEHRKIPILVLEGSGRKADELSDAFKSGFTHSGIIKAIIKGGDIRITSLNDGAPALLKHLKGHFLDK